LQTCHKESILQLMGFERFTETGRSFKTRLSIRSNGQIGFTQGAIHRFKMQDFKYAVLFYDKDKPAIGIRLTNDEAEEGRCKLQVRPESATISAKSFLDYYGINHQKTRSYGAIWDDENTMITASLNEAIN